jgi:hypothetical protein
VVTEAEFVTVVELPRMELNPRTDSVAPAENRRTKLMLLLFGAEEDEVPDAGGVVL